MYQQIEKLRIFLENAKSGFAIVEINNPIFYDYTVQRLLSLPIKATVLDMRNIHENFSYTFYIMQKVEENYECPIFIVTYFNCLSKNYKGYETGLAMDLNLHRDVYSELNKIFVFILPGFFVDVILKHAKDFYDFVMVKCSFDFAPNLEKLHYKQYIDKKLLKNRAAFLNDMLLAETENDIKPKKINQIKEELDKLLRLNQDELDVNEDLEDPRSRAVTIGDIARIMVNKGELDDALKLYLEALNVYEELGDQRSRAVTIGDIARIKTNRGQLDEALRLNMEELNVYEELGDIYSKAATLCDIANIHLQNKNYEQALALLMESYKITIQLGRLDTICVVGLNLGQLLCQFNQTEQALTILNRSKDGFIKLGQPQMSKKADEIIKVLKGLRKGKDYAVNLTET